MGWLRGRILVGVFQQIEQSAPYNARINLGRRKRRSLQPPERAFRMRCLKAFNALRDEFIWGIPTSLTKLQKPSPTSYRSC
jgi:hypothetical protein